MFLLTWVPLFTYFIFVFLGPSQKAQSQFLHCHKADVHIRSISFLHETNYHARPFSQLAQIPWPATPQPRCQLLSATLCACQRPKAQKNVSIHSSKRQKKKKQRTPRNGGLWKDIRAKTLSKKGRSHLRFTKKRKDGGRSKRQKEKNKKKRGAFSL